MRTFVFVLFVLYSIIVVLRLFLLALFDYPRDKKTSAAEEVIGVVISAGMALWAANLLWG